MHEPDFQANLKRLEAISDKPALVFDIGGVLLDWDPGRVFMPYFAHDRQRVEQFMAEIDFHGWNGEQDKGRSFAAGVTELSARFPQYAAAIRAYDFEWERCILGPIQGTVDMLPIFRQMGFQLYGLTNFSAEKFQVAVERFPILAQLDTILVSGKEKIVKPDEKIFQRLLQTIGRPAPECVFIDDSLINVQAARRLGMKAIHFKSPGQFLAELTTL